MKKFEEMTIEELKVLYNEKVEREKLRQEEPNLKTIFFMTKEHMNTIRKNFCNKNTKIGASLIAL